MLCLLKKDIAGFPGTPQRIEAEERAYAFYTGQILHPHLHLTICKEV